VIVCCCCCCCSRCTSYRFFSAFRSSCRVDPCHFIAGLGSGGSGYCLGPFVWAEWTRWPADVRAPTGPSAHIDNNQSFRVRSFVSLDFFLRSSEHVCAVCATKEESLLRTDGRATKGPCRRFFLMVGVLDRFGRGKRRHDRLHHFLSW
jgi:hypothetical protein